MKLSLVLSEIIFVEAFCPCTGDIQMWNTRDINAFADPTYEFMTPLLFAK
jgi:hypothetical protein